MPLFTNKTTLKQSIMRRLFFIMLAVATIPFFSSCSKEDDEPPTYSVRCDDTSGYNETLFIFECNSQGEKVYDHKKDHVSKGFTYTFTASSKDIKKIKIYITVESTFNSWNKWVQRVYYLEKGKTTEIVINSSTLLGPNEP